MLKFFIFIICLVVFPAGACRFPSHRISRTTGEIFGRYMKDKQIIQLDDHGTLSAMRGDNKPASRGENATFRFRSARLFDFFEPLHRAARPPAIKLECRKCPRKKRL